jgi:hypothetical protein
VKRLAIAADHKLFMDGVHRLLRVKHNNIVRFLGYCADANENVTKEGGKSVSVMVQERLLCFEYLCNGNLQMHLTGMYGDGIQIIPFFIFVFLKIRSLGLNIFTSMAHLISLV